MKYIHHATAKEFHLQVENNSVKLICIDPPYFGIVDDGWDNQWATQDDFVSWLITTIRLYENKLTKDGSLLIFGGIGKHGCHPFFEVIKKLEKFLYFRNFITWKKRRAYGKSHDYLFCREEIVWFSKSLERTEVVFNVPLLDEERGYAGFNKDYPAKSEFKRVSNVWTDYEEVIEMPEIMRPERTAQKPLGFMQRLIETHSNPGDLVLDIFSGWGSTGVAALQSGRRFIGCEINEADSEAANERCVAASLNQVIPKNLQSKSSSKAKILNKRREVETVCGAAGDEPEVK